MVLNPTKLEGVDVQGVVTRVCAQEGWDEPLFIETEEHDVGFGQTRQALAENVDVVCAFGGDGTVRAVAQEMVGSGVPMGLLPGGTGNLLARNLELPTDDLARAVMVAITGRNRHIDVGWMRLNPDEVHLEEHVGEGSSVGPRRHAFLVMAGLGLDAAIMEDTSEKLKAKIGWTAYVPGRLQAPARRAVQGTPVRRRRAALDGPGPHRADRQLRQADRRHQPDAGRASPTTAPSTSSSSPPRASPRGRPSPRGCSPRASAPPRTSTATAASRSASGSTTTRRSSSTATSSARRTHIEVEVQPRALIVRTETGRPPTSLTAQNLRSRHCRSNGSRQVYGAMSWWIWFGPHVPCA